MKEFWAKYKWWIIGIAIALSIFIAGIITYVEVTSGKKAKFLIEEETARVDSLYKVIKEDLDIRILSLKDSITKTEIIINVKETNYKKIIQNYEKDSVAIANFSRDSIKSFIARELAKRRSR